MGALIERDPGPMARLREVMAEPETPGIVFQRLTDAEAPQTLDEIAKAWGVPRGRFVDWYTSEHADSYDRALRVLGASLGHRVLALTDSATPETVGLLKFQTDRYLRLAAHWDAARYSPKVEHKHSGQGPVFNVTILEQPSRPVERVIEQEPTPLLPAKVEAVMPDLI